LGDPEVMRYVGEPFADSEAARRTLARASEAQERYGVSLWAVVEKTSGEIVGACGFHVVFEGSELELAYHFKRSHWGRGFATEAARACVLYAAEVFGTLRLIAAVQVGNTLSRRVLEKIGFRYQRTERAGGVDEEWFSNR
jgi:ribosomal-protein-alanine N-acetyltransferase